MRTWIVGAESGRNLPQFTLSQLDFDYEVSFKKSFTSITGLLQYAVMRLPSTQHMTAMK